MTSVCLVQNVAEGKIPRVVLDGKSGGKTNYKIKLFYT